MRAPLPWKIGIITISAAIALMAVSTHAQESSTGDAGEILKIHKELITSHLKNDAEGVLSGEADAVTVVSRGEVLFPRKADRLAQYSNYLGGVEFDEYRDLITPIVRVSEDGTLGWLIARVSIIGRTKDDDGSSKPFESIWAWVELYEKHDGQWFRVGEVSNRKPSSNKP